MIQAMYSGISGMKAFKSNLDVIGNNIANVNTIGYKAARATFKEMLSQTIQGASAPTSGRGGTNPSQIGLGVVIGSIDVDGSQGSMTSTGRQTDLAVEGNGFFALGDGKGIVYTRDGSLALDSQNNLVSASTGLRLLGWTADPASGVIDTSSAITGASGIQIPIGSMSLARQTSKIDLSGNLNAAYEVGKFDEIKFDVFDSLGLSHELKMVFTKAADQQTLDTDGNVIKENAAWNVDIFCPDVDATNPIQTTTISFDDKGYSQLKNINIAVNFTDPNGSVQPLNATIDTSTLKQLNGESTAALSYQDGLRLGTLESFGIDRNGMISGTFTNGSTRPLGQIAVAQFNNPDGLAKIGSNLLTESPNSGAPRLGLAGEGGRGRVSAGFLEASNVDLANEFANMIVAQRGFQANSRIITVSDEVLQELVSLKR